MCASLLSFETILSVLVLLAALFVLQYIYRGFKISGFSDRYVLVTGCDTGFGYRTAKKLDGMGFNVFAACLTKEKMEELTAACSPRLTAVAMNVTDDSSIVEALSVVKSHLPKGQGLWALVNNAGIVGPPGITTWLTKADYEVTMKVNFYGLVMVTKTFLPLLRQGQGRVINTASTVGRFALPPCPYTMSKFCVEAFTDVLRRELRPLGVTVHTVEPGGYKTNITDYNLAMTAMEKSFNQAPEDVKQFYGHRYVEKLSKLASVLVYLVACPRLYEVVDTYIHAICARYPKTRYVVGLNGTFFFRPLWTMPTWLSDFLMGMGYPLPG
ncbi:retinol dehydrogenase 7 isoform X2 [Aplysia californica]|nr:retinol dehydrogenase 7 isoform X2 [Aplysia californica]XP_005097776.1 retinol dehydrogenase 7 isoform X2 [Aplysia californica]XP_005097778.1 retinol dehydrogenase 7 isoform X2 [Aplysia californica]XP_005097779.1 retinol dehydrogenase 7 isoform X2 [Aplysia californica]XP_005097780.1 retinol dehydrogenase 7 isoform X2 [Aplysia californica]XP_012937638.1 retinol dehydrogenase 7 isoform X2 [Aplysia californica]XP_012937639.1 retinol dehydrogenase 7 isoform X2 [Aplysia californica]